MLCFGVSALCVYECVCLSYFGGFHWFCAGHFSALEHVSLCVCVVLESLSRKSAAKQPEARKNSFTLSLSVSLSLNFVSKQKECSRNCKRIDNVSTTSLSFGRKKNNQNVHNIRRRFIGGETKPFTSAHNKICKIFIFFFFLLLALKIIRRLRLFDTPILSVFLKKSRPFRHHSTATWQEANFCRKQNSFELNFFWQKWVFFLFTSFVIFVFLFFICVHPPPTTPRPRSATLRRPSTTAAKLLFLLIHFLFCSHSFDDHQRSFTAAQAAEPRLTFGARQQPTYRNNNNSNKPDLTNFLDQSTGSRKQHIRQ